MLPEHSLTSEQEHVLVRRARWGDQQAFARLYRAHASAVHTLAWRLTGDHASAEDITQETFMRMSRFLGGLREGVPMRPWLKRVAANQAIDLLRRNRTGSLDETLESFEDPGTRAPDHASEVDGLLRRLPPLARTLVWLHGMEGWSHPELGERFGRTPSWSKSIVSRALARLRRELEEGQPR